MENLILIIFLILVICFMFLIIIHKQNPEKIEQSYVGRTVLIPYYRWWYDQFGPYGYNWWPYYGSGSSTYYSTYRYPRHRRHRRHRHKHSKKSITIIADRTGKTHVASRNTVIPVTVSGKADNIRLARMKNPFTNTNTPAKNKSINNKVILLKKSKNLKK